MTDNLFDAYNELGYDLCNMCPEGQPCPYCGETHDVCAEEDYPLAIDYCLVCEQYFGEYQPIRRQR